MTSLLWDGTTLYADSRTTFSNNKRRRSADGASKILTFDRKDFIAGRVK